MGRDVQHKPAAAWSRDSLTAWQWMAEKTEPKAGIGTDPKRCQVEFLRRWAAKIVVLVHDEMGWCDWYWFLSNYFDAELKRLDPHARPLREIEFTGGDFETDPATPPAETPRP